eukprot:CAMPEP_0117504170 /NCGR_PEP_ID=MMETSP0784-20121206/24711_1 /TAXON_ID=39447 /ORGANISM="" /LENGTH=88 /DNA_ID=CAMNT_0005299517 /DNA_START=556 /DNA_END=822 /DNA_ORIENTATION=+
MEAVGRDHQRPARAPRVLLGVGGLGSGAWRPQQRVQNRLEDGARHPASADELRETLQPVLEPMQRTWHNATVRGEPGVGVEVLVIFFA